MSNPPTSNNIFTSPAATPHPPNAPFPTLWPSEGSASAITRMTATPTPLTLPNPSSSEVIPHPSLPSKFPVPFFLMPSSPLITTYYPDLLKLNRILRGVFHILSADPTTLNLLKTPPTFTSTDHPTSAKSSALVPPTVDPSSATIPTARHVTSTSPSNHSLAQTPALLILSPPLPIENHATLHTNSNVKNVMDFRLEKRFRCSQIV